MWPVSEPAPAPAPASVPHSFRRESRLFLWVALLLILFLNFLTLLFFRSAVAWGSEEAERRTAEILRRVALSTARGRTPPRRRWSEAAIEPDVAYIAIYDADGRRLCSRSGRARRRRLGSSRGRAPRPAGSSTSGERSRRCCLDLRDRAALLRDRRRSRARAAR